MVHGRDIPAARLVDCWVLDAIRDAAPLAPLHNPANLEGILAASGVFDCPQVLVMQHRRLFVSAVPILSC